MAPTRIDHGPAVGAAETIEASPATIEPAIALLFLRM